MTRPIDIDKPAEHLPACGARFGKCARGCHTSPQYARIAASHYHHATGATLLTFEGRHHYPQGGEDTPPLWEQCDPEHMGYLRSVGIVPPLPETFDRYERSLSFSLDRFTANDGEANVNLELAILRRERSRTEKIRQTNEDHRARVVATWIRDAFPGVEAIDDVADMHNGFVAGCYAGIVWGLALYMFGLTHDPLPEHVSGRILRGAPVRDTRAPFKDLFAVLYQRNHGALGAGNRGAWPSEDNRPTKRTRAIWGEMKVSPTHGGGDAARGEVGINRALSGQAAVRRAALTSLDERMVAIHLARGMTREQRTRALREVLYESRGGNPDALATAETKRLQALHDMTYVHELAEHQRQLDGEPDKATRAKRSEVFADMIAKRLEAIAGREHADHEAYPRLLRDVTSDVSDDAILAMAKACAARLRAEVYRASAEGDELATKPPPMKPKPQRVERAPLWEPAV